ncbi:RsmB/NOP family class I SAM-dependent RNA methyltransferase [Lachnospiraceae bacterium 62-35]
MKFEELPFSFREHMKKLLDREYEDYKNSFEEKPVYGLRVNTWKTETEFIEKSMPFSLEKVPWTENGFYYESQGFRNIEGQAPSPGEKRRVEDCCEGQRRPSREPYYYAGLYYLQEPSAMAPAALLPVKPGDRVLDLCAAPGGKSTELGARLKGQGLLFSNDISNSRAKALLKNLELFGIPNFCVASEAPENLAEVLPEYFDAILVDAPCSGEGMFRRDNSLVKDWMEKGPSFYAPLQREILEAAIRLLKPGGYLLYSTCTFSRAEDEEQIQRLLDSHSEMCLVPLSRWEGARAGIGLEGCIRLFPHRIRGEGHFIALLQKRKGEEEIKEKTQELSGEKSLKYAGRNEEAQAGEEENRKSFYRLPEEAIEFLGPISASFMKCGSFHMIRDGIYLFPPDFPKKGRIRYLRTGLFLGTWKKGRFEPSQALAMALRKEDFPDILSFSRKDERVIRYLKGETLCLAEEEQRGKGWCLVCVDGFPLGWGKRNNAALKNKYYPGWRWQ